MIRPLDFAQHSALAQQSLATDSSVRDTGRAGAPAPASATDGLSIQTEDWFALTHEIAVSASRSQETVEAHAERVLSHLLSKDNG